MGNVRDEAILSGKQLKHIIQNTQYIQIDSLHLEKERFSRPQGYVF